MWFLTGALGFLAGLALRMMIGKPWKPPAFLSIEGRHTAIGYELPNKGNASLNLGVVGAFMGPFRVREEGSLDAVGRALGMVNELQTGDPRFDNAYFLELDDPLLEAVFAHDESVRRAVSTVFYGGATELRCAEGVVWAEWSLPRSESQAAATDRLRPQIAALHHIASRIQRGQGSAWSRITAPASRWPLVFNLIGASLLGAGSFAAMTQVGGGFPHVVAAPWIQPVTWGVSGVALSLLLLAVFLTLREHSRLHRVLFEVAVTAGCGLWLLVWGSVYALDVSLDHAPAVDRAVRTLECRHTTSTHKGTTHHHYHIDTEPIAAGAAPESFDVDSATFGRCKVGSSTILTTHPGFLRVPWVSALEP